MNGFELYSYDKYKGYDIFIQEDYGYYYANIYLEGKIISDTPQGEENPANLLYKCEGIIDLLLEE